MSAESTEPTLPPLAIARVAALLDAQGAKYGTDDDGDLFAAWDGNPFWFMVVGKEDTYLQIRGRWGHTVPSTQLGTMLIACNEWSQQMLWPKVYVKADEQGVAVYSELTIAWDHGVTDEQLDLQLSTSIGSSLGFFREMTKRFVPETPSAPVAFHDPARPTAE